MTATIRPYRPTDRAAVGKICIETGDFGKDATGNLRDDQMLPAVCAYPYVDFSPETAWVVDVDGEAKGYIISVPDVFDFSAWWKEQWTPQFDALFSPDTDWGPGSEWLLEAGRHPENMCFELRKTYPAEFHIDLLPEVQGQGFGRQLVEKVRAEMIGRGVSGLAIGVGAKNHGAVNFYNKIGMTVVKADVDEAGEPTGYMFSLAL